MLNPWEWCHRLSNPVFYFETWKYYCLFSNRKTKRSILIIDNLANDMYFMSRLWHHLHAQLFMVTCIHNIFTGSILNACIFYQLLLTADVSNLLVGYYFIAFKYFLLYNKFLQCIFHLQWRLQRASRDAECRSAW